MKIQFPDIVGGVMAGVAVAVVAYAVIGMHSDTALGLIGGVLIAASKDFLKATVDTADATAAKIRNSGSNAP